MALTPTQAATGATLTLLPGSGTGITWQPGQVLQARVLNADNPQQATLNIGGRVVQAQIDFPLKAGQVLDLVVVHGGAKPQLQLAERMQAVSALEAALRVYMPRQQALGDVMRSFFQLAGSADSQRQLPSAVDSLLRMIMTLPDLNVLSTASVLKQAMRKSGLFFEALAAQNLALAGKNAELPDDLKHRLLQLSAQLRLAIEQGGPQHELLDALLARTEAALARLLTLQINQLLHASAGPVWMIELPLSEDHAQKQLQMRIRRHQDQGQDAWQVRIRLDIGSLGPLEAVVAVKNDIVNIHFIAEQQATAERFARDLEQLRHDLQAHGLDTGQLNARQGMPGEMFNLHSVSLVDETA